MRLRVRTASSTNSSKVKPMKASTKIEAADKLREVEGSLQEAVREAARNRDAEAAGKRGKGSARLTAGSAGVRKAVGK
jgi:hypothetical protein